MTTMTSQLLRVLAIVGVVCLMPRPGQGHGRMFDPPGRTGRLINAKYTGDSKPKQMDFNDNGMNCGGMWNQISHGYKCGVCGDKWQASQPRDHEVGGKYVHANSQRPIAGKYQPGQETTFTIQITANHLGWVSFQLCPMNDFTKEATQQCLDNHPVKVAPGMRNVLLPEHKDKPIHTIDHYDMYRYNIGRTSGLIKIRVIIPGDVTCDLCTLQWRYHTANSWGTDPVTGQTGLGFGHQEEFYGCSDVQIAGNTGYQTTGATRADTTETTKADNSITTKFPRTTTTKPTTTTTTTTTNTNNNSGTTKDTRNRNDCFAIGAWTGNVRVTDLCRITCIDYDRAYNNYWCPEHCGAPCHKQI